MPKLMSYGFIQVRRLSVQPWMSLDIHFLLQLMNLLQNSFLLMTHSFNRSKGFAIRPQFGFKVISPGLLYETLKETDGKLQKLV